MRLSSGDLQKELVQDWTPFQQPWNQWQSENDLPEGAYEQKELKNYYNLSVDILQSLIYLCHVLT